MIFKQNLKLFFLDDCHFGYFTKLAQKKNQLASRRGVMNQGGMLFLGS
jgi:hypothetical protein